MRRMLLVCSSAALILAIMSCGPSLPYTDAAKAEDGAIIISKVRGAKSILNYPSVRAVKDNTVLLADGTSLPYDDNFSKSFDEKLKHADIKDHFAQIYPAFAPLTAPAFNNDPGRFRNDELLKKLYGESRSKVEENLAEVTWLPANEGKRLLFNKKENAAKQLQKVSNELDKLPSEYMKYIKNIDGTYQYRPIAGTTRLSPHSYGIAIDLDNKYTSYWLWDKEYRYKSDIPQKIVDIFEKYGFVWGGRWYHYDTMHFEYRPEMFERVL